MSIGLVGPRTSPGPSAAPLNSEYISDRPYHHTHSENRWDAAEEGARALPCTWVFAKQTPENRPVLHPYFVLYKLIRSELVAFVILRDRDMAASSFACFASVHAPLPHRTVRTDICRRSIVPLLTATSRSRHVDNATACNAQDISWSPEDLTVSGHPPLAGTVLYNIPSLAPHLHAAPPLAHSRDGDGFVLAVSFAESGAVWARARFVRTRYFMREAKEGRRRYRGRYGTPGISGLLAPVRPKAACADGITVWGYGKRRRVLAYGDASLPMAVDLATLVSKRYTAMGKALTDDESLFSLRGAEISAPPVHTTRDTLAFCAKSRTVTGRVTGLFICEVDSEYNLAYSSPSIPLESDFQIVQMAVTDSYYVVFMHKLKPPQRKSASPLSLIFGDRSDTTQADASPSIDEAYGTKILFVPVKYGTSGSEKYCAVQLPNILVTACTHASTGPTSSPTFDISSAMLTKHIVYLNVAVLNSEAAPSVCALANIIAGSDIAESSKTVLRRLEIELNAESAKISSTASRKNVNETSKIISDNPLLGRSQVLSYFAPAYMARASSQRANYVISAAWDGNSGSCGLAVADIDSGGTQYWSAGSVLSGARISRPVLMTDGSHAVALVSEAGSDSTVALFDISNISTGPVCQVSLPDTRYSPSVGSVWCDDVFTWEEHGKKIAKSAYELFASKNWNDINSSFSSFGINQ